jgi:WD40 repeat protein
MSGVVIASIAGGCALIIGLVVWLATRHPAAKPAEGEQAAVTVPNTDGKPGDGPVPPVVTPPTDGPKPKIDPKPKDDPKPKPKGPPKPPAPETNVVWTATPDPLAAPVELPPNVQGTIPIGGFTPIAIYPSTPSAFVCVSQKGPRGDVRELWDLRTMKRVGTVDASSNGGALAVSPDGAFIITQDPPGAVHTVAVWSVADGKLVARIPLNERFPGSIDVDFAGPGKILVGFTTNLQGYYFVWDLQAGAEVFRVKVNAHTERKRRAISPNRKYLALSSKDGDRALVYDLATGALAGEALLPEKSFFGFHGLAFSPDGKSLAAIYDKDGASHFVTWDTETGKVREDHKSSKDLKFIATLGINYDGPPIEWIDDSSGWLIFGTMLVEAKGVALYWTIKATAQDNLQYRLFGTEHVARVINSPQGKTLKLEKLPADQLAAALKAVQSEGDTERIALTTPDWSASKKLPAPTGATAWQAKADPATAPKSKLAVKPIQFKGKAIDFAGVAFSGPESAQAAVFSAPLINELGTKRTVKADRYDLASGKHLGSTDLFAFETTAKGNRELKLEGDLSPDGSLMLVKGPKGKRIDVWSMTDGKALCAFSPLDPANANTTQIHYAAFVDDKHILTLSGNRLALWAVPSCKAVWWLLGVSGTPVMSPGHKQVAVCAGSSYDLFDIATGDRIGTFGGPAVRGVGSAAFRPDGKQFAATVTTTDGKNLLTRWDATTGAVLGSYPMGVAPGEMSWAGDGHVLINSFLFDLDLGWMVCNYGIAGFGRHAGSGLDGRHWYVVAREDQKPGTLTAQTLPDAFPKELARGIADKSLKAACAPGMTVTVQVQAAVPGVPDSQRRNEDMITSRLRAQGFKVGPGGELTLRVQLSGPRGTGETQQYETVGINKTTINVSVQAIDGVATLSDAQGLLWEQKATYKTPDTIGIIQTNDIQATLTKALWDNAANFPGSLGVPSVVVRGPKGVQVLPQPMFLTGDH